MEPDPKLRNKSLLEWVDDILKGGEQFKKEEYIQKAAYLETRLANLADQIESGTPKISDGYHTFEELYLHRAALFIALAHAHQEQSWRSKLHADGTMYPGFFVAGIYLPAMEPNGKHMLVTKAQITYHLELRYWEFLNFVTTFPFSPWYDGHTPNDVVERLLNSFPRSWER